MKTTILAIILFFSLQNAFSQNINVSGIVYDENGNGLPGAIVILKGTEYGTITDFDGVYNLENVPPNGILIFRFVGFADDEINIYNRKFILVGLSEKEEIEEVDIGWGMLGIRRETKEIGYSTEKIISEDKYLYPASGKLFNSDTLPICNAKIYSKRDSTLFTLSDSLGFYSLPKVLRTDTLIISSDNCITKEINYQYNYGTIILFLETKKE